MPIPIDMKVVDLGEIASRNSAMAIRLDSAGRKAEAIDCYRLAIDALDKMVHLNPGSYKVNELFIARANAYQNRVRAIEMAEL